VAHWFRKPGLLATPEGIPKFRELNALKQSTQSWARTFSATWVFFMIPISTFLMGSARRDSLEPAS
jgi:hypothetical protein